MSVDVAELARIGLPALLAMLGAGGLLAWRKDKREEPKDRASAIGDMLTVTERSAVTAAQALAASTEARAEASQATADAQLARAEAAQAKAELARQKKHADEQDNRITAANERITMLRGHVQTWMRFGVLLHDQWANLRLHLDPPPLPEFPTDDPSDY